MTALVMLAVGEFRVLYWCRPMPACISGNKRWHPDGYLIWCPRTGFSMVDGGHVWLLGGMHGSQGVCMVAGGCVWLLGGYAWLSGGHAW